MTTPVQSANKVIDVAYYTLQPEVAGGLGNATVMDTTVHPPLLQRLHYEFEDWLGDDLVESFPCFLVSEPLAARLTAAGLGTFQLKDVEVTMTPEAKELLGDNAFPNFYWFDVAGTAGRDDVGITLTGLLVVSDQALAVLREFNIDNCDVEPFQP
jgi:hypothetical protein